MDGVNGAAGPRDQARLDHIVYLVGDLERAQGRAREHGFTVLPGGTHAGGLTRNALIGLQDGSYVELLEFTVPGVGFGAELLGRLGLLSSLLRHRTPLDRRFVPRAPSRSGVIDLAVTVPAGAPAGEIDGEGPVRGRRVRPDGVALEWDMFFPSEPALPFVLRDVTDRALRVPDSEACRHANGIRGVARVVVAADDPDLMCRRLARVTGAVAGNDGVVLGDTAIRFMPPEPDGNPYRVWVRVSDGEEVPLPSFTP